MSELERAREHLRAQQKLLSQYRKLWSLLSEVDLSHWENGVKAALSWVWEEQEKLHSPRPRAWIRLYKRERVLV